MKEVWAKTAAFLIVTLTASDEVIGVLTKHVRVTPADIRASMPFYLSPDGRPNVESLAAQQEWYVKMGMVRQAVPMDRVVDLSFLH